MEKRKNYQLRILYDLNTKISKDSEENTNWIKKFIFPFLSNPKINTQLGQIKRIEGVVKSKGIATQIAAFYLHDNKPVSAEILINNKWQSLHNKKTENCFDFADYIDTGIKDSEED